MFVFIRFGGQEIRLTRGSTTRPKSAGWTRRAPAPSHRGNFLVVAGLPVYADEKAILKWLTDGGYTIKRSTWGADTDLIHRFIIEISEDISAVPAHPKHVAGAVIEVTLCHSIEE